MSFLLISLSYLYYYIYFNLYYHQILFFISVILSSQDLQPFGLATPHLYINLIYQTQMFNLRKANSSSLKI